MWIESQYGSAVTAGLHGVVERLQARGPQAGQEGAEVLQPFGVYDVQPRLPSRCTRTSVAPNQSCSVTVTYAARTTAGRTDSATLTATAAAARSSSPPA
jgi:hypothetical protein